MGLKKPAREVARVVAMNLQQWRGDLGYHWVTQVGSDSNLSVYPDVLRE